MLVRVAVSDPLPLFRRGVVAVLSEAGFATETPDDLLAWALDGERRIVLLTLHSSSDWALLSALGAARTGLVVVATLEAPSTALYVRAVLAGAAATMRRDATPEDIREVFAAAASGRSLLPTEVVRELSGTPGARTPADPAPPPEREIDWLRQLAGGDSVRAVADRASYSERMMFRLLRDLYTRLGTANRTEALIHAQGKGWL
nr:hypothetical protein GCM10020092_072600 [Actinoplanes digitatis]